MDIILKQDIAGLGYRNEIISVKPGYGNNYLIPQGFATLATKSTIKVMQENIKQAAHKAEKIKTAAEAIAEGLNEVVLEIAAKVGDGTRIFGKVTTTQISDALKSKGFEVDRKKIILPKEVKVLGDYVAMLDLHKEVKKEVKFSVIAD
jgi:large subunit ribosomal protein L9